MYTYFHDHVLVCMHIFMSRVKTQKPELCWKYKRTHKQLELLYSLDKIPNVKIYNTTKIG